MVFLPLDWSFGADRQELNQNWHVAACHIYIYSVILFWGQTLVNDGKRLASVQIYAKLNRLLNFVLLEELSVE